jgi:hypothetical protein
MVGMRQKPVKGRYNINVSEEDYDALCRHASQFGNTKLAAMFHVYTMLFEALGPVEAMRIIHEQTAKANNDRPVDNGSVPEASKEPGGVE